MKKYEIGDIIECKVTGIETYGIFVNVDSEYTGLIHISEITHSFVRRVEDYVKVGESIFCKVIHVDDKKFHLRLSIKDLEYIKQKNNINEILESKSGFKPLKDMLPEWTRKKIEEFSK